MPRMRLAIDLQGNCANYASATQLSHCEIAFHNANVLASHKGASYNRLHRLQQFATSAVSSTSSFGGLNPNRSFGFFFAHAFARIPAASLHRVLRRIRRQSASNHAGLARKSTDISSKLPHVLTCGSKFHYNSRLFRIRARGGRTRESLHAPRCAHYKQEKTYWAQQFFWIDHEDVFRKSP